MKKNLFGKGIFLSQKRGIVKGALAMSLASPFMLFVFLPLLLLQFLGFDWKHTELYTYFMGFCFGILLGWCFPQ